MHAVRLLHVAARRQCSVRRPECRKAWLTKQGIVGAGETSFACVSLARIGSVDISDAGEMAVPHPFRADGSVVAVALPLLSAV